MATSRKEPVAAPDVLVGFVSSNHSGVVTASGASFSLTPGVTVPMLTSDARALAAQGLGYIQGD